MIRKRVLIKLFVFLIIFSGLFVFRTVVSGQTIQSKNYIQNGSFENSPNIIYKLLSPGAVVNNWSIIGGAQVSVTNQYTASGLKSLKIQGNINSGISQRLYVPQGKPLVLTGNINVIIGSAVVDIAGKRKTIQSKGNQQINILISAKEANNIRNLFIGAGVNNSTFYIDNFGLRELDMKKGNMIIDPGIKTDEKAETMFSGSTVTSNADDYEIITQTIPIIIDVSMQVVANHCDGQIIDPNTNLCQTIIDGIYRDFNKNQTRFEGTGKTFILRRIGQPWDQTIDQGCGTAAGGQTLPYESCHVGEGTIHVSGLYVEGASSSGGDAGRPTFRYVIPSKINGYDNWLNNEESAAVFNHELGHIFGQIHSAGIDQNVLYPSVTYWMQYFGDLYSLDRQRTLWPRVISAKFNYNTDKFYAETLVSDKVIFKFIKTDGSVLGNVPVVIYQKAAGGSGINPNPAYSISTNADGVVTINDFKRLTVIDGEPGWASWVLFIVVDDKYYGWYDTALENFNYLKQGGNNTVPVIITVTSLPQEAPFPVPFNWQKYDLWIDSTCDNYCNARGFVCNNVCVSACNPNNAGNYSTLKGSGVCASTGLCSSVVKDSNLSASDDYCCCGRSTMFTPAPTITEIPIPTPTLLPSCSCQFTRKSPDFPNNCNPENPPNICYGPDVRNGIYYKNSSIDSQCYRFEYFCATNSIPPAGNCNCVGGNSPFFETEVEEECLGVNNVYENCTLPGVFASGFSGVKFAWTGNQCLIKLYDCTQASPTVIPTRTPTPTNTPTPLPQFGICGSCSSGCTPPNECRLINDNSLCTQNNKSAPCCLRDISCSPDYQNACGGATNEVLCNQCSRYQNSSPFCSNFDLSCGIGKPAVTRLKSPSVNQSFALGSTSTGSNSSIINLSWYAFGEGLKSGCAETLPGDWSRTKWTNCDGAVGFGTNPQCVMEEDSKPNTKTDRSCWGYACAKGSFGINPEWRFYKLYVKEPSSSEFTQVCNITNIPNTTVNASNFNTGSSLPVIKSSCNFTPTQGGNYQWYVRAGYTVTTSSGTSINYTDSETRNFTVITPTNTPTSVPQGTCEYCRIYNENWIQITDLSTVQFNQRVYLTTRGTTNTNTMNSKARFRVNMLANSSWCTGQGLTIVDNWCETTNIQNTMFYVPYTFLIPGEHIIESMVYNQSTGWY